MNKNLKLVLIVTSVVLFILLILFFIDLNRIKNNQEVLFSTWGLRYAPPLDIDPQETPAPTSVKHLEDFTEEYSIQQAIEDGFFVITYNKIYNKDKLDSFIENTSVNNSSRKSDTLFIARPTTEGDLILFELEYDSNLNNFILKHDSSRDNFASTEDRTIVVNNDIPGIYYSPVLVEEDSLITFRLALYAEISYTSEDIKIYEDIDIFSYSKDSQVYSAPTQNGIQTILTLEDKITEDSIWCGTFQLIWNDLKNDLAKQDIIFTPQLQVVENLNKETFKTSDISDKYYYKKIGTPSIQLKQEIEKAIKNKFNETSDILDDFDFGSGTQGDYFLYVMLKKIFEFETKFEELENDSFGKYEDIKYFGITSDSPQKIYSQVSVLYYNSKDDFAIKLKTKQEDEVILCKNPSGSTFNEIYQNITTNTNNFKGKTYLSEGELLKIPNIKLKEKTEFKELENKYFYFSNGNSYYIEKALQTIQFELDKTGGKVKSEAGIMLKESAIMEPEEKREFFINDTFAIFLIEKDKSVPYLAGKINDITKFQ